MSLWVYAYIPCVCERIQYFEIMVYIFTIFNINFNEKYQFQFYYIYSSHWVNYSLLITSMIQEIHTNILYLERKRNGNACRLVYFPTATKTACDEIRCTALYVSKLKFKETFDTRAGALSWRFYSIWNLSESRRLPIWCIRFNAFTLLFNVQSLFCIIINEPFKMCRIIGSIRKEREGTRTS